MSSPITQVQPLSATNAGGLGPTIYRARWWIVLLSFTILVATTLFGAGAPNVLSLSRYEAPGSESRAAAEVLADQFGTGAYNVTVVVSAREGTVDDPAIADAGRDLLAEITANAAIVGSTSYWTRQSDPVLASTDKRHALILLRLPGSATETRGMLAELAPQWSRQTGLIEVNVGGGDEIFRQVAERARRDFLRAEAIIFPGVFLLLAVALRSPVAAFLPLIVGFMSVSGTLAFLRLIAQFAEVSTFALNLTLALGLGLGVDYGLFIITRFREARGRSAPVQDAVGESVRHSGRTIVFSGCVVAISLAAMFLFPFPFLRSFAYAGVGAVACAILAAGITLPALLTILARWIPAQQPRVTAGGLWHNLASAVMRRPLVFGVLVATILGALSSPLTGIRIGLPDDRIMPQTAPARITQAIIRENFIAEEMDAFLIALPDFSQSADRADAIASYAAELSRIDGIASVSSSEGEFVAGTRTTAPDTRSAGFTNADAAWLRATPFSEALEIAPYALVDAVRTVPAPAQALVGGYPADLADFRAVVLDHLPFVFGIIVLGTIVVLFVMIGSVLLPLKATLLNAFSLTVMLGTLVFVFQNGNFAQVLGFTPMHWLETSIPILMFCIAYGLSMDYEVFMLSRIREEYEKVGDNETSVALGLEKSGPLITTAAVILALCFLVYISSSVTLLKMLGLGIAVAILIDATVIRAILVPAIMKLAGNWNWWAPAPLARFHRRFGLRD